MFDTKGSTKHQHIVIPGPMKVVQTTLNQGSIYRRDQRVSENKQCRDKRKVIPVFNCHDISVRGSGGVAPRISI
jgi:hypothetical protein